MPIIGIKIILAVTFVVAWIVSAAVGNQINDGLSNSESNPSETQLQDLDYFAENGFRDAAELIYHPSGHFHNGTTYLAYEGTERAPHVCAYDHNNKQWTGPIKAGDNPLFKHDDGHGRPSIVVDDLGFIHIVYGGHGGPKRGGPKYNPIVNPFGTSGLGEQIHVVSIRPGDITQWRKVENISPHGTYSQLVKADDDNLFLFYRHGTHKSDWVYQRSTDHGRTFEPPVVVIKHKTDLQDPKLHESWYAHIFKGTKNTVHVAFVLHPCHETNHQTRRRNVHYIKLDLDQPTEWTSAAGKKFPLPIDREQAYQHALVFDSGDDDVRSAIARGDDQDEPHLVFRQTPPGKSSFIVYTRWTGSGWQKHTLPASGRHDRGTDFEATTGKEIRTLCNIGPVVPFTSTDGGVSWSEQSPAASSDRNNWHISARITDCHPDARWVLVEHGSGDDNSRLYLWGDHGFVKRTKQAE